MPRDLERTLREVPRRFPRPDRTTTAETLRDLRRTFGRDRRPRRRRTRTAFLLAVVGAGAFGAVGWAIGFGSSGNEVFPRPVAGPATFLCPRYLPEFKVEVGSVSGGIYGQATTKGAPVERGGSIVYAQVSPTTSAVDRLCRRSSRASAGRAAGFVNLATQLPQQSSYGDYEDLTCIVRGRILARVVPLRDGGRRIGTRLDIGIEGRRNLIARIVVRKGGATMQTSALCV